MLEQIEECWKSSSATVALLDEYKAELNHTSKLMNSSMELQRRTDKQVATGCLNVPTVLTTKGGQVEVTERTLIPDLEDAVMLATSSVNCLNTHVVLQAEKVLECLRACRDFKQGIHLSSWGISQAELAEKHKQEHVRELQLLHVPRAVQNVLLSGEAAVSQDVAQVKSLEKVRDLHNHMHVRFIMTSYGQPICQCAYCDSAVTNAAVDIHMLFFHLSWTRHWPCLSGCGAWEFFA